jgi:DNA-binding CsgD family transcriptional regulator
MRQRFALAVEAIYDAAESPSHWPKALQAIGGCLGDEHVDMLLPTDDERSDIALVPRKRGPVGNTRNQRSHCSDTTSAQAEPPWQAKTWIYPDPEVPIALTISRKTCKAPFSNEERKLLCRLGTHTERALRLSMRASSAEFQSARLGEALSRTGMGVFVIDGFGRVVFSSPTAQQHLDNGVSIINERLVATCPLDRCTLAVAIRSILRADETKLAEPPTRVLVRRNTSDQPLVVHVSPLWASCASPVERFLVRAKALVLVINPDPCDPPNPAALQGILGLTPGEARVAALVGSGISPTDTAKRLGITEMTARNVLKRVFSKVGISRQSELAALTARLMLSQGILTWPHHEASAHPDF